MCTIGQFATRGRNTRIVNTCGSFRSVSGALNLFASCPGSSMRCGNDRTVNIQQVICNDEEVNAAERLLHRGDSQLQETNVLVCNLVVE